MNCDFINYDFIKTIISVIIGAIIPVVSSYLLEKKRLTNNKKRIKFEQNLNTLKKLKVNHLHLVNLLESYLRPDKLPNSHGNYYNEILNISEINVTLKNELFDLEIGTISELHDSIKKYTYSESAKVKSDITIDSLLQKSKIVTENIQETIKNIDK